MELLNEETKRKNTSKRYDWHCGNVEWQINWAVGIPEISIKICVHCNGTCASNQSNLFEVPVHGQSPTSVSMQSIGGKKLYYRPFSSGSIMIVRTTTTTTISTFQPNFSIADFRALNVTTWNCHFLVISCDFDFNTHTHTPWWYHRHTKTKLLFQNDMREFYCGLFFIGIVLIFSRLQGASNLQFFFLYWAHLFALRELDPFVFGNSFEPNNENMHRMPQNNECYGWCVWICVNRVEIKSREIERERE